MHTLGYRKGRPIVFAAVLLTACGRGVPVPTPTAPPVVRLTPGTAHYLTLTQRHVEQQFRGEAIVTESETRAAFTISLEPAPGGFRFSAVVDSARVTGDAGIAPTAVQAAAGARFEGILSPEGVPTGPLAPDSGGPLLDQLALGLQELLLPRVPLGGVHPDQRWMDTIRITGRTAGLPLTLILRSSHQTGSWMEFDGVPVLPVTTQAEYDVSAAGERAGQWIAMDGAGSGRVRRFLTEDGIVVLGVRADTLHVAVELPSTGLRYPLTQTSTDTVRRVPR